MSLSGTQFPGTMLKLLSVLLEANFSFPLWDHGWFLELFCWKWTEFHFINKKIRPIKAHPGISLLLLFIVSSSLLHVIKCSSCLKEVSLPVEPHSLRSKHFKGRCWRIRVRNISVTVPPLSAILILLMVWVTAQRCRKTFGWVLLPEKTTARKGTSKGHWLLIPLCLTNELEWQWAFSCRLWSLTLPPKAYFVSFLIKIHATAACAFHY